MSPSPYDCLQLEGPAICGASFLRALQPQEPVGARRVALGMLHNPASRADAAHDRETGSERDGASAPGLAVLIERFAKEGRGWAEAEVTLARVELSELRAQLLRALLLAVTAAAALLCAMIAFSQAGIAYVATLVDSTAAAALIIACVFALVAVAVVILLRRTVTWRAESIFFRWFGSRR